VRGKGGATRIEKYHSSSPASSAAFQINGPESRKQFWTRPRTETARNNTDRSIRGRESSRSRPLLFFWDCRSGYHRFQGRIQKTRIMEPSTVRVAFRLVPCCFPSNPGQKTVPTLPDPERCDGRSAVANPFRITRTNARRPPKKKIVRWNAFSVPLRQLPNLRAMQFRLSELWVLALTRHSIA